MLHTPILRWPGPCSLPPQEMLTAAGAWQSLAAHWFLGLDLTAGSPGVCSPPSAPPPGVNQHPSFEKQAADGCSTATAVTHVTSDGSMALLLPATPHRHLLAAATLRAECSLDCTTDPRHQPSHAQPVCMTTHGQNCYDHANSRDSCPTGNLAAPSSSADNVAEGSLPRSWQHHCGESPLIMHNCCHDGDHATTGGQSSART